jgi:transcriptional antiterminator NusG
MSSKAATYTSGDHVRVVDGPLSDFEALVREVDSARNQLSVTVTLLGQPTHIQVEPWQIEKIS